MAMSAGLFAANILCSTHTRRRKRLVVFCAGATLCDGCRALFSRWGNDVFMIAYIRRRRHWCKQFAAYGGCLRTKTVLISYAVSRV
ncbi:hypothetical protein EV363DRAFT_1231282, partial [Boletus edulis]